jgi:hypothetical protein
MIPIQPLSSESACRPEWVKLNHLLSYCSAPLSRVANGTSGEHVSTPRCKHQNCLFSATKL